MDIARKPAYAVRARMAGGDYCATVVAESVVGAATLMQTYLARRHPTLESAIAILAVVYKEDVVVEEEVF